MAQEESGLLFMRARFYEPGLGVFTGRDPLGMAGGDLNFYRYAGSLPTMLFDPTGQCVDAWEKDAAALQLGLLGVAATATILEAVLAAPEIMGYLGVSGGTTVGLGALSGIISTLTGYTTGLPPSSLKLASTLFIKLLLASLQEMEQQAQLAQQTLSQDTCQPHQGPQPGPGPGPAPPGPGPGPGNGGGGFSGPVGAGDPNGLIGPAGYGPAGYIAGNALLPYRIDFENATNATAPAQQVNITDQLGSNYDWSTFNVTEFGFGDLVVAVPPGASYVQTNVPLSYLGHILPGASPDRHPSRQPAWSMPILLD